MTLAAREHELLHAAVEGDLQRVAKLVWQGTHCVQDKEGLNALHLAAANGHAQLVQFLLDNHAVNVDLQDKLGFTALHRAAGNGFEDIAQMLIAAGADTQLLDYKQENTCVHESAHSGHAKLVAMLLQAGCNLYTRNKSGSSALHVAAQMGRTTTCKVLLVAAAKPDVRDKYDDTPLHAAVRNLHTGATKVLLAYGANSATQNKNGDTPLHVACNMGHRKLVKLLLESGASKAIRNKQNETPVDIASRKQCGELMQLLNAYGTQSSRGSSTRTDSPVKRWGRHKKSKIRAQLEAAKRGDPSDWHVLFQDFNGDSLPKTKDLDKSKVRLPLLRKGEQYFVDLNGKIHKRSEEQPVPDVNANNNNNSQQPHLSCYCAPFFCRIAEQNTHAHKHLLGEIDGVHDELSHEIHDLRQVTERKLADLHRNLKHCYRQNRRRRSSGGRSSGQSEQQKAAAAGLQRWHSESEIGEPDLLDLSGNHSAASDDIYLERYCRPLSDKQQATSAAADDCHQPAMTQSISHSEQASAMESIRESLLEQSMREFNRIDLDDSCTTPTSNGTADYRTQSSSQRSSSHASSPKPPLASPHLPQQQQQHMQHSLYLNNQSPEMMSSVQPPSLDSGYGMSASGVSPVTSPATPHSVSKHSQLTIGSLSSRRSIRSTSSQEACTQTEPAYLDGQLDQSCYDYSEVHDSSSSSRWSPRVPAATATGGPRPPPTLTIPPPPNKPLPPIPVLPLRQPQQQQQPATPNLSKLAINHRRCR